MGCGELEEEVGTRVGELGLSMAESGECERDESSPEAIMELSSSSLEGKMVASASC